MNLIFDQGNTFLKCARFSSQCMVDSCRIANQNEQKLRDYLQKHMGQISKSIFSGVGNKRTLEISKEYLPNILELTHQTPLPFTTQYQTPETWGADRRALVAGALVSHPAQAVLVVDAGTCVTFDLVNENAVHVGGSIHPGLAMRAKAMNAFTARLPLVEIPDTTALMGNTTESNLQSGALHGFIFEVNATIQAYKERYPQMTTLITGGDAKYLAEYVKNSIFAAPNLILHGLNNILEYNAAQPQ